MPLLSVILPTHDRMELVGGAIDSVLRQTERDLELIVVDDGSTDDTPKILARAELKDHRLRIIRLATPSGAAEARNRGVAASDGEFVAFLDDDDEWLPTKAADQIAYLRHEQEVGVVSCDYEIVAPGRRTTIYRGPARYSTRALYWANFPGGCSFVMVRREAIPEGPVFDTTVIPCEDWDLWLRCAGERGGGAVSRVGCRYVVHAGSRLTGTSERRFAGSEAFVEKWWGKMTPDERDYHTAALRLIETEGTAARLRLRATLLRRTPARITSVIAQASIATRVGRLTGDPGLSARALLAAIGRVQR